MIITFSQSTKIAIRYTFNRRGAAPAPNERAFPEALPRAQRRHKRDILLSHLFNIPHSLLKQHLTFETQLVLSMIMRTTVVDDPARLPFSFQEYVLYQ